MEAALAARQSVGRSFQAGVAEWMGQCFLPSLYSNMTERGDRLLEEVLELLQAHGYDKARVPTLVDYVFGRPVGEPAQEVGGVMVTLAGYCWVAGLDMHAAGDAELARISQPEVMAKIRAKQEAKNALHFDTPLPGNAARQPVGEPAGPVGLNECPITGLPFYDNMEHPEHGLIAMYGGPLDVYSIPRLDRTDDELRVERYDLDADGWVEGGEPMGYFYREQQPDAAPPAQAVDLRQIPHGIRLIEIPRRNNLDPINVFVQDYELGRGRIVVTCYGQAWCGFWGAMGDRTVMQFVAVCDADYVAGNMLSGRHEHVKKHERTYVERIATAVIAEFRALISSQAVGK